MKTFITNLGVCWAVFAWSVWPITPHRGYESALICVIYLAPSYLILSAFRSVAIPMRIFVATAMPILITVGLRLIPGRYDMFWPYLICPPAIAFIAASYECLRRNHVEEKGTP